MSFHSKFVVIAEWKECPEVLHSEIIGYYDSYTEIYDSSYLNEFMKGQQRKGQNTVYVVYEPTFIVYQSEMK